MSLLELICFGLFVWWLCSVFNITVFQWISDDNFDAYSRRATMCFSFVLGPITTLIILVVAAGYFPVKFGTRWGRQLGRFFEDLLD